MRKYYTRACNFYHGSEAIKLIKTKKALPLNGKNNIAFDSIEIFSREKREVKVNYININKVFKLNKKIRKLLKKILVKLYRRERIFLDILIFNPHQLWVFLILLLIVSQMEENLITTVRHLSKFLT